MTARRRISIGLGGSNGRRSAKYPYEADYVADVSRQTRALTDRLIDIMNQFKDVSEDIMKEALEPTFEKSQYYVPKLTGELAQSGYLEVTSSRGKPRVEIGYGRGGKPDYAVAVHEEMEVHHAFPTRAKFLQAAILEDTDDIYERLGRGYRRFMGGAS